jgi:small conductance mechanosensitive channel
MMVTIVSNSVLLLGVLVGLSQLGVQLGPLLAGLGIAGFIVGFALQDSLANFAAGMMILGYRPYDVGDMIEAAGVFGKVNHMSLVSTTILTIDNQTLIVPNGKIWGDVIKNVTHQSIRRVDMTFGVSYAEDIDHVERVLHGVLAEDERVLAQPEPMVKLHKLNESSVDFVVRPWVKTDDYWDVYWDMTRAVKKRFDAEGITIPFPQRQLHIDSGGSGSGRTG